MTKYNLIMVLDPSEEFLLMCYRQKNPYQGKYNLVGGKIEDGEEPLDSAYRELEEETGISSHHITLFPFIDYVWHPVDMSMNVFIGKLHQKVELIEEANPLHWIAIDANFFDGNIYAGEGNIGHMVQIYKQTRGVYFEK